MKYFLTGVTGFIGSNLARQLVKDGHLVNAIIRNPASFDKKDKLGIRFFKGDLHDSKVLKEATESCQVVFHLAALAKPWSKDPKMFHRINVEGSVNVFEAALKSGVEKVVFSSSAATMSPSLNAGPVNEATPRTVPFFNAYESTKTEAEQKAREYCDRGLPVVIVNPTRVYGPGPVNPSNSITRMIAGYQMGTWRIIPGDGTMIGNYVFIDDVVNGHILAASKGRAGERYILGGENLSFEELFQVLAKATGKQRRMIHLSLPVMTSVASFLTWQASFTGIPPAITPDFMKKYHNHWSLSSDKALRELGYTVTPFVEGVAKTLQWLNAL